MQQFSPALIRRGWETGNLGFKLRNIQKQIRYDWLNSKTQKYYIESTRRMGKSTLLLILLSEFCIKNKNSRAGYYAPVKEGLKDYVEPIITAVFADCPDDLRPKLYSQLTLCFPNGSAIIFRGSNNQQFRLRRGNDLQLAAVDEGRDVDDLDNLIDSVIIPSLFTTGGKIILSSTPADTEDHPLFMYRQQAEKEGWFSHYTIYQANEFDPADFPLDKIELWKKETNDPIAWQREYLGMWVKDPTRTIIPEWDDKYIQTVQHDAYFPHYHKYDSMDLGVRDKTAAIFGYYDFLKAKIIIESEFVLQDSEVRTDTISKRVKETEVRLCYQQTHERDKRKSLFPHEKVFKRISDNNNPMMINDLDSIYDLDFFPTRKDELPAMINFVREWVKDGKILISPVCKELIGCLKNAIWDKNKKDLDRSKIYGHFDALMALVYLVRNIDTHTNPIPKHFGKTWATHAIGESEPNIEDQGYRLAKIFNKKTDREQARQDFVRGNNGIYSAE